MSLDRKRSALTTAVNAGLHSKHRDRGNAGNKSHAHPTKFVTAWLNRRPPVRRLMVRPVTTDREAQARHGLSTTPGQAVSLSGESFQTVAKGLEEFESNRAAPDCCGDLLSTVTATAHHCTARSCTAPQSSLRSDQARACDCFLHMYAPRQKDAHTP